MLIQPRHDLDEIAGPRAVIELRGQDAVPAVAAGAGRSRQAEDEGRIRDARRGAALYRRRPDLGMAQHVEGDGETIHPFFEQRLDRLVAAEFDYTGGILVTEPIVFKGKSLVLNIDTGATGEGRVALLHDDGSDIEGFSLDDCDIINGDWMGRKITWRGGESDLSEWSGKPVRLQFSMRGARLYAMRFE